MQDARMLPMNKMHIVINVRNIFSLETFMMNYNYYLTIGTAKVRINIGFRDGRPIGFVIQSDGI
jgi:hypothetical protein